MELRFSPKHVAVLFQSLIKQSSLDDQESLGLEVETSMANENGDELAEMSTYDERRPTDNNETNQMFNNHILNMYNMQVSPPPQHDVIPRGLPWKPKVRQKDIDVFLDSARQKFLGYSLPGDRTTLFGLPEPIHEGVRVLNAVFLNWFSSSSSCYLAFIFSTFILR